MKKPIYIWESIFRQAFWVYRGIPKDEFKKSVKHYLDLITNIDDKIAGMTVKIQGRKGVNIIIIWVESNSIPLLSHEVFHGVYKCLSDVGITLTEQTEEVYAYFIEKLLTDILGRKK
jgi:hypothetical protein